MRNKHKSLIDRMQRERKTICEFCGAEKEGLSFVIGASSSPDWCMIEGTGKMACPACYEAAMKEGREVIDRVTGIGEHDPSKCGCQYLGSDGLASTLITIPSGKGGESMEQGNIKMEVVGGVLVLKIDLDKDLGRSKSGKNILVASTKGNVSVPGYPDIKLGVNCYK